VADIENAIGHEEDNRRRSCGSRGQGVNREAKRRLLIGVIPLGSSSSMRSTRTRGRAFPSIRRREWDELAIRGNSGLTTTITATEARNEKRRIV
jgi:hypothetical protein